MNHLEPVRPRPLVIAGFAVLAMGVLLMLVAPSRSLAASEAQFCTGVKLTGAWGQGDSTCAGTQRWLFAVYAQGEKNKPICAGSMQGGGGILCSDNNSTVYHSGFDGTEYLTPIILNGGIAPNKVSGAVWYDPDPYSWHTENLGGNNTSDPDISSPGKGQLDIYVRGSDNALWTRHMSGRTWGGWQSLGGILTSGPGAVYHDGQTNVMANGTGGNPLWNWNIVGGWWGTENLGGSGTSDPDVSSWGSGRLDAFVRGSDNALWHRYWNGSWSSWEKLGGSWVGGPGAVSWGSNRIDVVTRGTDNAIYHWYYDGTWHCCENVGGVNTSDADLASTAPGHLNMVVRGSDNALWQRQYDVSSGWGGWERVGGNLTSGPAAVSWGIGNRLDVVAKATDNTLTHWYWGPGGP
jgi:hypothetical protein